MRSISPVSSVGRVLSLTLISCGLFAAERTSETDAQLQRALQRFPADDADKDGVLTESEVRTYRGKVRSQRDGRNRNRQRADDQKPVPTHADVHYGPHERQVLDVYLAKRDEPTPLVVYIHGGGFV